MGLAVEAETHTHFFSLIVLCLSPLPSLAPMQKGEGNAAVGFFTEALEVTSLSPSHARFLPNWPVSPFSRPVAAPRGPSRGLRAARGVPV